MISFFLRMERKRINEYHYFYVKEICKILIGLREFTLVNSVKALLYYKESSK